MKWSGRVARDGENRSA